MLILKIICIICVFICSYKVQAQNVVDATQNQVLSFPLGAPTDPKNPLEPSKNPADPVGDPYMAAINSVFDHTMGTDLGKFQLYGCDQRVRSFSLEEGANVPSTFGAHCVNGGLTAGFSQSGGERFFVNGTYAGAGEPTALFYDGHPGIDFVAHFVPVKAVAKGTIYYPRFMRGITDGEAFNTYHVLALIPDGHPDLRLYYLHLATHPAGEKCPTKKPSFANKCPSGIILPIPVKDDPVAVSDGEVIGISGDAGVPGKPHLHFEVQRILPLAMVDPAIARFVVCKEDPTIADFKKMACLPVDPYGWDRELVSCTQKPAAYSCKSSAIPDPYTMVKGIKTSSTENGRLWNNLLTIDTLTATADLAADAIHFVVSGKNIDSDTRICFWQKTNPTPTRICPGRTDSTPVTGQLVYDGHLEPGDYFLYLESGDGHHRSNARSLHIEKRTILPPTAAFTMSLATGLSAQEGGTLLISVPIGKTVPTIFDAARSLPNGSFITGWTWQLDGVIISTAESFVFPISVGTHEINLTVMDALGLVSSPASGTISATQLGLSSSVVFDGSKDSLNRFFFASFGRPITDSSNNVLVISTHFGFSCPFNQCGIRANSIAPSGTLNWQSPKDGSFISFNVEGGIAIGQNDQLLVPAFGATLFSIDSQGVPVSGWPVLVGPQAFQGQIIADARDGSVYASGMTFSSSSGFPGRVVARMADGSPKWTNDYPSGGLNIVQGPNRDIYAFQGNTLIGLDHGSGSQFCNPAVDSSSPLVGGPEGVFFYLGTEILSADASCQFRSVFSSSDNVVVTAYINKIIYAIATPLNNSDPALRRLTAISNTGTFLWKDSRILLPSLQASNNGLTYVTGFDLQDGQKSKLFILNSSTGEMVDTIETSGICDSCAFTIAGDGTIYVVALGSTKIFKLN
jgi:hypothetical protein